MAAGTWLAISRTGQGRCQWKECRPLATGVLRTTIVVGRTACRARLDCRAVGLLAPAEARRVPHLSDRLCDSVYLFCRHAWKGLLHHVDLPDVVRHWCCRR